MYESPRIVEVGSTLAMTLGHGIAGRDDFFQFVGKYGQIIDVTYGVAS